LLLGVAPDLVDGLDREPSIEERSIRVAADLIGIAKRTIRACDVMKACSRQSALWPWLDHE